MLRKINKNTMASAAEKRKDYLKKQTIILTTNQWVVVLKQERETTTIMAMLCHNVSTGRKSKTQLENETVSKRERE